MSNPSQGRAIRETNLGIRVARTAALMPANGVSTPYFTVAGGRVMITSLTGIVTTIFQANATTLKFSAVPTTGTANNMSAVSAALTSAEIGALISLDGVIATALQVAVANSGAVGGMTKPSIVGIGTIDAVTATAENTGGASWALTYIPLEDGASIVVA